uniref:Uncharacterized protein n=1 Tax=Pygocentrus nattereri TaxID=42514 RepID=A0A3B4BTF3_PYGNA
WCHPIVCRFGKGQYLGENVPKHFITQNVRKQHFHKASHLAVALFAMSVFAFALLVPAGWIMHHIPVYRQRPPPQV